MHLQIELLQLCFLGTVFMISIFEEKANFHCILNLSDNFGFNFRNEWFFLSIRNAAYSLWYYDNQTHHLTFEKVRVEH